MALDNRINVIETDLSGFTVDNATEIGAMVVIARKGKKVPQGCLGEADVIKYFGNPSSDYSAVFEAISYARRNKIWVVAPYGADSLYGGLDVYTDQIVGFGDRTGRDYETFQNYSAIRRQFDTSIATGDGEDASESGTLPSISGTNPILEGSLKIKVGGKTVVASESGGAITGSAISGSGTLNRTSGAYSFVFAGSAGTVASYTSTIDGSGNFDLSVGLPKAFNLIIDSVEYENINLGSGAAKTLAQIVSDINTAVGSTVATVSTNFINIVGSIADVVAGNVKILPPTDLDTYASAVNIVFQTTGNPSVTGTNPTGSIPRYGQDVTLEYITTSDQSANIMMSFFLTSPCDAVEIGAKLKPVTGGVVGTDFNLEIYQKRATGYTLLTNYIFSLTKGAKNGFGASTYIFDVFKNNQYVIPFLNSAYTDTANPTVPTNPVDLTGGLRTLPLQSDINAAWDNFAYKATYPVNTFLDALGNAPGKILTIRNDFQTQAYCATVVPFGQGGLASDAKTYRESLAIDDADMALYTSWTLIRDPYNNSEAWTSRIGGMGVVYAAKDPAYDSLAPAGINLNINGPEGGQINSDLDFTPLQTEGQYNDSDLDLLDNAQINPIILDPTYGLMAVGDRTLQVTLSDTSYIGTRRLYNRIIENIKNQVLKLQVFKNNDAQHQDYAKGLSDGILAPIFNAGFLQEYFIQCDSKNNTQEVKNRRQFVLSIFVKAVPNSQGVILQFTRVSQTQVIADIIPQ